MSKKIEQRFDDWFAANYNQLKDKCILTNTFGEVFYDWQRDVFHNCFLAVRESLNENEDFEQIFISSFKKYCRIALRSRCKEIVPSEIFWKYQKEVKEEEENESRKEAKETFAAQILLAAKMSFSRDEYQIFKLHFQSNFNFRQIGDVFGTSGEAVQYRFHNLCSRLFCRFNNSFNNL